LAKRLRKAYFFFYKLGFTGA